MQRCKYIMFSWLPRPNNTLYYHDERLYIFFRLQMSFNGIILFQFSNLFFSIYWESQFKNSADRSASQREIKFRDSLIDDYNQSLNYFDKITTQTTTRAHATNKTQMTQQSEAGRVFMMAIKKETSDRLKISRADYWSQYSAFFRLPAPLYFFFFFFSGCQ